MNYLNTVFTALLILAFFSTGVSAQDATQNQARMAVGFRGQKYMPAPGVTQRTVVYKKTKQRELKLHLHFPAGWKAEDKRPVMVFFFGGGWKKGTANQFLIQADYFASRGIVTARPQYRIKNQDGNTPDKSVEDARSSIRWLRANAKTLGIDPGRLIAAGGSAGGHLAYCTSIKESVDSPNDDVAISCLPQAMILYNPALFASDSEGVKASVGAGMSGDTLKRISPLDHVTKQTPPSLIIFGTKDRLKRGADIYLKMAKGLGVLAEMWTAEGMGHGFFNKQPWLDKSTNEVDEFLVKLGYISEKK